MWNQAGTSVTSERERMRNYGNDNLDSKSEIVLNGESSFVGATLIGIINNIE
jgi:hypothetical protein